ncbi:MAG: glucose-6-phosphate dehydrogenase assembly protein OpcA [Opitutaceae bacterium]
MTEVFEVLPGLDAPLGALTRSLTQMWSDTEAAGRPAPPSEDAKATQLNVVLHLGTDTDLRDAENQFQTVVRFSRRYPSRVVVLCPEREDSGVLEMRAKVYGECTLGKSKGDTRCCEFVLLKYSRGARPFLESQVSICLSTDLPLYYWAHRFSSARLADYRYLLTRSNRVLIDSAVEPANVRDFSWPRPEAVRDLAGARLLSVRQSLGQFLSRYPMEAICSGLVSVVVKHGAALAAESRVMQGWLQTRVCQCGENRASFSATAAAELPPGGLAVDFVYAGAKSFRWTGDTGAGTALFTADFGTGRTVLPATVSLLSPEAALSEAMFFG